MAKLERAKSAAILKLINFKNGSVGQVVCLAKFD